MLEGLMQHDYPLTLRLILERMRKLYPASAVVGMRDARRTRRSFAEICGAGGPAGGGARAARRQARRPCRDVRVEQPGAQ